MPFCAENHGRRSGKPGKQRSFLFDGRQNRYVLYSTVMEGHCASILCSTPKIPHHNLDHYPLRSSLNTALLYVQVIDISRKSVLIFLLSDAVTRIIYHLSFISSFKLRSSIFSHSYRILFSLHPKNQH